MKHNFLGSIFVVIFILSVTSLSAQFSFSGKVNSYFKNAKVYLFEIKDLKKREQFIPENILFQTKVKDGFFSIEGDFLNNKNRFYKIYLDNCVEGISNSKHLLNQCTNHVSVLFIAKNKDTVFFPLNSLDQMFCDLKNTNIINDYIKKIDSIQEQVLEGLPLSNNDKQKEIIYQQSFNKLKKISKQSKEPLAELYAFCLYSDENSYSRKYYLLDLKKTNYYSGLSERLIKRYPKSKYGNKLQYTIEKDSFSFNKKKYFSVWRYVLFIGFCLSILLNIYLLSKRKRKPKPIIINEVLSKQELKVFSLMLDKQSNKQIADGLFISLSTVKTHINNIYKKLKITSRKDLVQFK